MRKIHRLDLDFAKDIRTQRKITFKEQDSITLYMSIYNDGVPVILDNQTPRLFIKKSDGTILYQTEVLSIQNNVVAFDVHRQATTCPGLCYAEVEFIEPKEDDKEELITTRSFVYIVEPKVGSIKDAIASVDEAYFLKIVEEFIAQAKIDIAEFRDAVASLEDRVIEVDNKLEKLNEDLKQADLELNEAKENALEEISDFRYEAIDDVQEARDEAIDTITLLNNETVQIIDQIKNNSINLIIDEKDNSIKEMAGFKDACLEAIELLKNGTVSLVYQAKNDSINEINDTADRHLTTIENNAMQGKEDIINLTKTSKEEITGLTNESKEAIEALRNEVIDNIDDYTIEHIEELESIIESLIPTVGEGKELEASLISLQENLTILKDTLQKLNGDGYLLSEKLESNINIAKTTQSELLTAKNEAISVKVALNQVIEATESLKNALILENERAEANIEELQILHPESDIRIEELRRLIELAKQYEEVVRTWIANREPAMNLDEVNAQLEELYNAISSILSILDNYYTKKEVDNLIEEAINGVKGTVGEGGLPGIFNSCPEPEQSWDAEICGYAPRAKAYFKIYYHDLPEETESLEVLRTYSNGVIYLGNTKYFTTTYAKLPDANEWELYTTTLSSFNTRYTNLLRRMIYKNTLPLTRYSDSDDDNRLDALIPPNTISSYNHIIESGLYKVNHSSNIEGAVKASFEGLLSVENGEDRVAQTLIEKDGASYTRYYKNGAWSDWQGGNNAGEISYAVKTEFDNSGEEFALLWRITPEQPSDYPYRLMTRLDETKARITYSKQDLTGHVLYNRSTKKITFSKEAQTEFDTINYTTLNVDMASYSDTNAYWTTENNIAYGYNTSVITNFCSHNFDIYDTEGNIYRKSEEFDTSMIEIDFNKAIKYNSYNININEGEEIKNSPLPNRELKGVLFVNKSNNKVLQTVITQNNETEYKRLYNGVEWTEWQEGAGASNIDLNNFYTKEETDELLSNVEVDLSGYATKEELQEAINNIDIPEIDMSSIYTKEEIDEKLIKKSGIIKSGNPNFKEPVWDELPTSTFINIPANPDPATYKWEMKCSHYGYHMVFYFPKDPTGKFGIVERSDGKLGFKLLDSSFKYTTYKSYYKSKNTSTSWSNMPSDNHFTNPGTRELEAMYSHNFDIVDGNNPEKVFRYGSQNNFNAEFISDFNIATEYETYTVEAVEDSVISNSPINGAYKGILKVYKADKIIHQEFELKNGKTFKRMLDNEWTEWKKEAELPEGLDDFMIPFEGKINTHTYTNSDGMPEVYNWVDLNGFKIMWINVKHSEAEYNSGVNGLMMKTLNFPAEAQIFNNIIMANITSYCRSTNNTLSRIVQNAEIISNVSVRGRWRHTDNTPPSIDRFTIMCFGF